LAPPHETAEMLARRLLCDVVLQKLFTSLKITFKSKPQTAEKNEWYIDILDMSVLTQDCFAILWK